MKRFVNTLILAFLIICVSTFGWAGQRLEHPYFQALDDNGDPCSGCKLYTYKPTSSTNKDTYTDGTLGEANDNPVELDARGEAAIYLDGLYKLILKDAAGDTIWTMDNVAGSGSVEFTELSDYTDFDNALDTISTTETTLFIDTDGTLGENETVPSTLHLFFLKGNILTLGNYDLTINGPLTAPIAQIFNESGTGSVGFGSGYVKEVYPQWWTTNATPGTTDMITAIQAAVDAVKGTVETFTGNITTAIPVIFSENIYSISSPIITYSGVHLIGFGEGSQIQEGAGWAGTELIQLQDVAAGGYYSSGKISHLELKSTTAGVAAVRQSTDNVTNSIFEYLILNTKDGIILDDYTQGCTIRKIWSYGPVERIIYLKGNWNFLQDIDKEHTGTGTSTDPYILIEDHTSGMSTGNYLERILLEGTGHTNKSGIKLDTCKFTSIHGFWNELSVSDGYTIRIVDSDLTTITGPFKHLDGTTYKVKIDTSDDTFIEVFNTDSSDIAFMDALEIDAYSSLRIGSLYSRRSNDAYILANLDKMTLDRIITRQIHTDTPAGYRPTQTQKNLTGQNLLLNGSFEAGRYGWTFSTNPDNTEEYIASAVGNGLMGHFEWDTPGSHTLYQTIVVDAAWTGQTLTFVALIKLTAGNSDFVSPYLDGAGISAGTGFNRVYSGSGWAIMTQSFTIQSTSNIKVGITFVEAETGIDYWVDECSLSFGTEALLNAGKFGSIELGFGGGNTITYGAAAPVTGTWKQGDLVFNTGVEAGGSPGWICTAAGSPGTWKALANVGA